MVRSSFGTTLDTPDEHVRTQSGEVESESVSHARVRAKKLHPPPKPQRKQPELRVLPAPPSDGAADEYEALLKKPLIPWQRILELLERPLIWSRPLAARVFAKLKPCWQAVLPALAALKRRCSPFAERVFAKLEQRLLPLAEFVKSSLPDELAVLSTKRLSLYGGLLALASIVPVSIVAWIAASRSDESHERNAEQAQPTKLAARELPAALPTVAPRSDNSANETDPPVALGVPLIDGSDSEAPSCEALLSVPSTEPYDSSYRPQAAMEVAHRYLVHGNWDASQRAFCKATRLPGSKPYMLADLAQFLLLRRDAEQAAQWAERAADLDPTSKRAQALLGDALMRTGEPERAQQAFLSAAGISGTDKLAISRIVDRDLLEAQRALAKRDYTRAERFFRRVIALDPTIDVARIGVATTLKNLGFPKSAELWEQPSPQTIAVRATE